MYDVLLIATDGSDHAESAAEHGFELARLSDATVHVVCIADSGPLGEYRLPGDDASAEEAIRERATEAVERLAAAAPADLDVRTAVESGPSKNEIVEYADEVDADLIVMGTRGRDGVERMLLGSVAEHVVRVSERDVLVYGDEGEA